MITRVGRTQPRDPVTAVGVDVRVVLGEDLGDAVTPAERVVECDLVAREQRSHSSRSPPRRRPVQLRNAGHMPERIEVMTVLVQQDRLEKPALPGGYEDRRRTGPAVARRCLLAAAERWDLRLGND